MNPKNDLVKLDLWEAREGLRKKHFSSQELTQAYLDRMTNAAGLNAYITPCPQQAIHQAKASDQKLKANQGGSLEGIPLGVKDNFCTQGIRTTAASRLLSNFVPHYESTITQRMKEDGAVFLGKTNLDEFACGGSNIHSAFGPVSNPWDPKRVPGGSSGGSAAALASGQALGALGSDTGGSVRQPAAFCGLVGLRPTYGRCSRFGIMSMACSLDQPGPMGRTVRDVALLFQSMAFHDPKDSQSRQIETPLYESYLGKSIRGMKIGIPHFKEEDFDPAITSMWLEKKNFLQEQGCEVVPVNLPNMQDALTCYYILMPAEVSSNMARYDGIRYGQREEGETLDDLYEKTRGKGFGLEVKRRILTGNYVLFKGYAGGYYAKALKIRHRIREHFKEALNLVDAMLWPTTPGIAPLIHGEEVDPLREYYGDIFTIAASLASVPGISVPSGIVDGLPLGMQLTGRPFQEERLLQLAHVLEQSTTLPPLPLQEDFSGVQPVKLPRPSA